MNLARQLALFSANSSDLAPSSTYLVIAGLAGPDYKVEIEGEAMGPA